MFFDFTNLASCSFSKKENLFMQGLLASFIWRHYSLISKQFLLLYEYADKYHTGIYAPALPHQCLCLQDLHFASATQQQPLFVHSGNSHIAALAQRSMLSEQDESYKQRVPQQCYSF